MQEQLVTQKQVLLLVGPTAVGKTAIACALYDLLKAGDTQFDGASLISVDSAMVYTGLDIGTAKPTRAEQLQYPHALIDIRDPAQPYSAADFVDDADAQVRQAWQQGKLPILVGGTMLYVKRFVEGIADLPVADQQLRQSLQAQLQAQGSAALYAQLQRVDPTAAAQIHPNNPQRLLRALEVIELTGQPISAQWGKQRNLAQRLGASVSQIAIIPDHRPRLHEIIEARFDAMLEAGFLQEVRSLYARDDLHDNLPAVRAVGYRQAWQHLSGELSADDFRSNAITATRRLAKRQLTWIKQWPQMRMWQWG